MFSFLKTVQSLSTSLLLFLLAGLLLAGGFIYFTQPLATALLVALMLAFLLNPLVLVGERRWPTKRPLFVNLVYGGSLLLIIGLLLLLGDFFIGRLPGWAAELNAALESLRGLAERPFTLLGFTINPQLLTTYLQNSLSNLSLGSSGVVAGVAENMLWLLVTLVAVYYLLRDGRRLKPAIIQQLPANYQEEIGRLWDEISQIWRVFLRVQLFIFFVLGILVLSSTSLIIWLFRQGWLPLSPIGLILLLLAVYALIQQVDNLWLRPRYMGRTLQLHPGVVIIALLAALALSGVLGALLIVPLIATLKVIGFYLYQKGWKLEMGD